MDRKDFNDLQEKVLTTAQALCNRKGDDYADEDTLSNFKRLNQLCQILDIDPRRSPDACARFLLVLKLDRWCNLVRKGVEPLNETFYDTILDLHNYIDLAYACGIDGVEKR